MRIAQAEVGAQVDDAHAPLAQLRDQRRRRTVRIGDDRRVDLGVAVEIELLERERHPVVGVEVGERAPDVAASA